MTKEIESYILSHSDEEGSLLAALNRDANVNLLRPRMLSGHLQGRILKMFCRMLKPKRVLEIGTYTGYATLCMAEALEKDAEIHTLEINDEMKILSVSMFPNRRIRIKSSFISVMRWRSYRRWMSHSILFL